MKSRKTNEVVNGSMQFIKALINNHYANAGDVYLALSKECSNKAQQILASDPDRNR